MWPLATVENGLYLLQRKQRPMTAETWSRKGLVRVLNLQLSAESWPVLSGPHVLPSCIQMAGPAQLGPWGKKWPQGKKLSTLGQVLGRYFLREVLHRNPVELSQFSPPSQAQVGIKRQPPVLLTQEGASVRGRGLLTASEVSRSNLSLPGVRSLPYG